MFLLAAGDPTTHIKDTVLIGEPGAPILTAHMITMFVAAGLTMLLMWLASRAIATGPVSQGNERFITRGKFAQLIEAMITYLRDEMIQPVLGEKATKKFLPFLLTLFFFILCNNVLGLLPLADLQHMILPRLNENWTHLVIIGGTPTGNIAITAGLAIVAGMVIVAHGVMDLGPKEFFYHMTGGLLPADSLVMGLALAPVIAIVFVIELLGLLIKPGALAIRLFANMVAGHTLLAVLLGFGGMAAGAGMGVAGVGAISIISGIASVLIFFLEIFVAFLQAFIFMFLTAVFISLLTHHEEHEHHDERQSPEHDDIACAAEHAKAA